MSADRAESPRHQSVAFGPEILISSPLQDGIPRFIPYMLADSFAEKSEKFNNLVSHFIFSCWRNVKPTDAGAFVTEKQFLYSIVNRVYPLMVFSTSEQGLLASYFLHLTSPQNQ